MDNNKQKFSEHKENIKYLLNSEYIDLDCLIFNEVDLTFHKVENLINVSSGTINLINIFSNLNKDNFGFYKIIEPFLDENSSFYKIISDDSLHLRPEKTPIIVKPLHSYEKDEFSYTYISEFFKELGLNIFWRMHYGLSNKQSTFRLDSFMTKFENEDYFLFFKNPHDLQNDIFLKRSIIKIINKALHTELYDELENGTLDEIAEQFKMIKY